MPDRPRVVLLAGDGLSTKLMYNGLRANCDIVAVVMEEKPSSVTMIRHRMKTLGWFTTLGQVAFIAYSRWLGKASQARLQELLRRYGLDDAPIPGEVTTRVASANRREVMRLLKTWAPDAIVVNGTRILSGKLLGSVDAPFINTHMGITPAYRGVHGGYWALAMNDRARCGVTVHMVDEGVDTGGVLYQSTIDVEDRDNFTTYPIHQMAKAIPLMQAAIQDAAEGRLDPRVEGGTSKQWYHPTLLFYLKQRLLKGIK
ncbi:formyltransferase family protein [Dyella japonica]|uniref:phosphoribosylglycinamide formyltransferase 1 n=1 Tax=Dyella japonica A8 TaxID=1217721 RepID=A0A075K713_9GAMM|nr:formyltransferase family protein [Dyella japonica]AIF47923.1 formyl transferase [Dyella japonica A8]